MAAHDQQTGAPRRSGLRRAARIAGLSVGAAPYTHLTLPTTYTV